MNISFSHEDGSIVYGGRVEVCYNDTYHPLCDDGWTDNDAEVMCQYVLYNNYHYYYYYYHYYYFYHYYSYNYYYFRMWLVRYPVWLEVFLPPTGAEATGGVEFGLSDNSPVLQNLMCSGHEYSLTECPGFNVTDINPELCPGSNDQAGFRCVGGKMKRGGGGGGGGSSCTLNDVYSKGEGKVGDLNIATGLN